MKLFKQNTVPQPNDSVELTIFTPDLGYFAITGTMQDVEPSYNQILQEEARSRVRRPTGAFALAGF